ncbi:retinoic acid receptor responder protein 2 isoform X1 [Pseudophryne corroboree]|uniref:retinoic acid receptor responder protein 2 isoform X1 n=1 Tax=Pseudophryne corroboree TaxID=495146 RepID=UPI00308201A6
MKAATRIWGLVSALLVLAAEGAVHVDGLSEIQNKAVRLVMEDFHTKDHLKNGFKFSSLVRKEETEYAAGIFVNVEFTVKQTTCPKHHWMKSDCEYNQKGYVFNCFACFKFEYETHKVLSQVIDCVRPRFVQGRGNQRNKTCTEVAMKTAGTRIVGSYSFVKTE